MSDQSAQPTREYLTQLRQKMVESFSVDELRTLCYDLGIDYESIPHGTKDGFCRELILYMQRRNRLHELAARCKQLRPAISWDDSIDVSGSVPNMDRATTPIAIRSTESRPRQGTTPPGPIRNRWALLVGVNRYIEPAFPPLNYCVNDVLALEQTLTGLGYTVVCMHDQLSRDDPRFPTRDNVEAELAKLCQVAQPDDLLWVHFACHGRRVDNKPLLLTWEIRATTLARKALPLAEVEAQMRASQAKRLALTLDVCQAGVDIGRAAPDAEFMRNVHDLAEGFALLAASSALQIAQEWKGMQHGVFTYYLLEGLAGKADAERKGFVTVKNLENYVLDALRRWSVQQPGLLQEPTARTEGLGDMILADYR